MIVVRDIAPEVMPTVDAGARRTYADARRMAGEENTSVLAAVARGALLWDRRYRTKTGSLAPTATELTAFLEQHMRATRLGRGRQQDRIQDAAPGQHYRAVPLAVLRPRSRRGRRVLIPPR